MNEILSRPRLIEYIREYANQQADSSDREDALYRIVKHDAALRQRIAELEQREETARGLLERAKKGLADEEFRLAYDIQSFLQQLPTETEVSG